MINDNDRAERDRHARCMSHVCRANIRGIVELPEALDSCALPRVARSPFLPAAQRGRGLTFVLDNMNPEVEPGVPPSPPLPSLASPLFLVGRAAICIAMKRRTSSKMTVEHAA